MKRNPRVIRFMGQRWTVRYVTRLGRHERYPADKAGDCTVETKTIRVLCNLPPHEERRVILHELMHAALPMLDEEAVDKFTEQANVALVSLGFPAVRS